MLLNMLSRLVTAFLPRSKHLLISWLQSPSAVILEPKKIVCHYFHCFPTYSPWRDGTRCHDLSFWMLSFKPAFSLSSFTFIKSLFSSSSLSAVRVVSSAYLKLLILLPGISIPAWVNNVLLKLHVSNYFMHIANAWFVTVRTLQWSECLCSPKTHIEILTHTHTPLSSKVMGT